MSSQKYLRMMPPVTCSPLAPVCSVEFHAHNEFHSEFYPYDRNWMAYVYTQLVRIIISSKQEPIDEEDLPLGPETVKLAFEIVAELYSLVRDSAPQPSVSANPTTGSITILFLRNGRRLELGFTHECNVYCVVMNDEDVQSASVLETIESVAQELTALAA